MCHRTFVSDDKLIDHVRKIHPGATVHTREEMIEDEQAQAHAAHQRIAEKGKEKEKEKEAQG